MEISVTKIISAVLLIGIRVSSLMLFAPFFANASIPARIKAMLAILITALVYPVYAPRLSTVTPAQWPLVIATEIVLGVTVGLTTNMVFEAVQIAGQLLSVQVGYSLVNILDPNSQVDSTVLAVFHQTIAMFIFLALNIHHWVLRAIFRSFDYLPPGTASIGPAFAQTLLHDAAVVLELSIQISAPVLAATILIDIVLGLLGKASPHMPLMLMGPAVKSMAGVIVLGATIRYWPRLFEGYFSNSIAYTEHVLHLAH